MAKETKDYSMYRYYKGEHKNPFAIILDKAEIENTAKYPPDSMRFDYNLPFEEINKLAWSLRFWEREEMFETQFNKNDFSLKTWSHLGREKDKWLKVLRPVDKKGLFELWNTQSLQQLSEKNEIDFDSVLNLYLDYSK